MPFSSFHERFPEVAEKETRMLRVVRDDGLVEHFGFVELFCDERGCDCRRVFLQAVCPEMGRATLATISFGWEPDSFYRRWASFPLSDEDLRELKGPALVRLAPQSEDAEEMLEIFTEQLDDAAYVERIKRHYAMFRETVDAPKKPRRLGFPRKRRKRPAK